MSSSVKYSPVPAVLTRPELLAELNLLMTRIASGCRVGLPASGRPVIAVHGGYVSYSSPRTGHVFQDGSRPETVMTVSNRERMCEWFSQVWLPLHLAALEGDENAFFSAEVNMVRRELQSVPGNSVNCMCWASLAALAFDAEERVERQKGNNENIATYDESIATYAFRAACTVSRCLSRNASGGIPRSYPEWKAILFPRDGADIFPDGWLENMTRRAERVFTSAKRQCGMLSASQAALFSQQTRQCASEQCTGRIQAGIIQGATLTFQFMQNAVHKKRRFHRSIRPDSVQFNPLILLKRSKRMSRFNTVRGKGVTEPVFFRHDLSVTQQPELQGVFHFRFNAGRQLFFCIHNLFPLKQLVMNERMLSVPSDRGRQTHRSENVQTVTGILFPTTVCPAPFFLFSRSQVSGSQRGRVRHG
ncbi:TPA: hypothetical protein ACHGDZ_005200 [Escherichia coli]